ncbi:hypothetical protein [Nonomuraea sp. NPDC048916]|uniref:hypothetical protein n=1 Tax=Nonomuraea sp. NPDC048916 TaxID=3154232 RepID=UPI0033C940EE
MPDGTRLRGVRSTRLWRRRATLRPGDRVALLVVAGSDLALITRRPGPRRPALRPPP